MKEKKIEKELQELHASLKRIDDIELIEQLDKENIISIAPTDEKKYSIFVNGERICKSDSIISGLVSAYKILNYVTPEKEAQNVTKAKESASEVLLSAVGMVREQPEKLMLTELIDEAVKGADFIEVESFTLCTPNIVSLTSKGDAKVFKISNFASSQLVFTDAPFTAHITPNNIVYFIQKHKK